MSDILEYICTKGLSLQDLEESFFSKIILFLIKDNLCDKRFLVLFLLLKQKNLDVYEKYSRFRKRLNYQDYRLSVKELKTFGSSGLNVIG